MGGREPGFWRRIRDGGLDWLHVVLILGVLVASFFFEMFHAEDIRVRFAYWFIFTYLCIILVGFAYFVYASGRKARYAEAMACIHGAIHTVRNTTWRLDQSLEHGIDIDEAGFYKAVQSILDSVAKAFSIVTGTNNRACIKVLGGPRTSPHVNTFCRDAQSSSQCAADDEREGSTHQVSLNTDFHLLLNGDRHFLRNDLSKADDSYRNSKVAGGTGCPKHYKATIVFPIRYALTAKDRDLATTAEHIAYAGFLAVDSQARGVYSERYDVEMGAIIADALFSLLTKWETVKKRPQPQSKVVHG